ncbi:unnamed protein product [Symbiodinium sp. KB8]|nr:unnamed protein product [Symbiodinium sp. KB8]
MDAGVGNLRAHVGTGLHDQSRNREGSEAHQPGRDGLQTGASETLHHAELDPLQQQQINQAATLSGRADVRAFESSRGVATSPRDATGGAAAKTWLAEADRGFGLNLRIPSIWLTPCRGAPKVGAGVVDAGYNLDMVDGKPLLRAYCDSGPALEDPATATARDSWIAELSFKALDSKSTYWSFIMGQVMKDEMLILQWKPGPIDQNFVLCNVFAVMFNGKAVPIPRHECADAAEVRLQMHRIKRRWQNVEALAIGCFAYRFGSEGFHWISRESLCLDANKFYVLL